MPRGWGAWASQAIRQEVLPPVYRGLSALASEGHECDATGTLDRCTKLALMSSTITGDSARNDFTSLGDQIAQPLDILIVDVGYLIRTEAADLLAWETPFRGHSLVASFACSRVLRCGSRQWPDVLRRVRHHRPSAHLHSCLPRLPHSLVRGYLWA
jgi:hypothetical protein